MRQTTSNNLNRGKKLIRAPDNLVSMLGEAAARKGKTFYKYVTEIFEQAIRADLMKHNLEEIIDSFELMEIHKEAGVVFVPRDVLDSMVSEGDEENGNFRQIWYRMGEWYGLFLKDKFNDNVEAFSRLLGEGFWDISEVGVKKDGKVVELRCVSTTLSKERTLFVGEFIKGVLGSLGYAVIGEDIFRGIISITFSSS